MQKRKGNKVVVVAAVIVVAVAVTALASKYKNIGQEKEIRQFREPMETRTGWKMMNTTDKKRKRDRSNSIQNNRLKNNNNLNHNNHKRKKIQKQMKTRSNGVQS
ncbi:MAG: hypothetical protein EZS28_052317 [Streblomastix strix]|uniref:Uncharacterized protein n=1 Tax=Streblomastix strix TaxID=222440 RepID=A0A5J4SB21_9EUKA|nr:MAG: hypothetical protein EZS28_052317 [Streblomastix strix]